MYTKLITLFIAGFSLFSLAQNTVQSPFSSYGFGERGYSSDAVTAALGQSSITYFDSTIVNFHNPASYNTLGQGQPLFSLGLRGRISEFSQNDAGYTTGLGMVDHFAMAFTLKKHFGLTFGLKPYGRRGYELTDKELVGSDSIQYKYKGTGGSNEVFIGLASTIFKIKTSHLSVGANLGYLFGTATNERKSNIIGEKIGGVDQKSVQFNSFHYELGAYFRQDFGKNHSLTLSTVLEPAQKLNASRNEVLYFASDVNTPLSYVTLYDSSDVAGEVNIAPSYSFGLSYSLRTSTSDKGSRTRNSEWLLQASYTSTDWSKYSTRFNEVDEQYAFNATSKLSIGIQYSPEYKVEENKINTGFFESMRYRIGYYNFNLPYSESGSEIKEFGTTFGIGIPLVSQSALSSVNLGVTLGSRGNGETTGLNERFIGLNFGVIIAPSGYDRWFKKRKLD
jgi:hypothetical protein